MASVETLSWRVNPALPAAKLGAALLLAVLAFVFGRHDPVQWVTGAVFVIALLGWALRDLLLPVRLTAGPDGVSLLVGLRRLHLPWSVIERVRVDRSERHGLRSEALEIDAGDSLHLFSANDLGAAPDEVAELLASMRVRGTDPA